MGNETKYPVLSKLVMNILTVPVTTVVSEATFNVEKRVIDPKRSSMKTKTVEMVLCGGDWVKEKYEIKKDCYASILEEPQDELLTYHFGEDLGVTSLQLQLEDLRLENQTKPHRLQLTKLQSSNPSRSTTLSVHIENQEEFAMADASPRTDISTDVDTDDQNQRGVFISSSGEQTHSLRGNGAMRFDAEYARWLEEQNRQINELRAAVNSHASDTLLRMIVDGILAHYDEIFRLKGVAAKADVFHLLSGMWKNLLREQQLMGIINLLQSSQQAEDALSQGMEVLQQSLAEMLSTDSSGNVASYMGQMAMAR
ncbi:transcription factor TGA2.2-like [Vicia villosa]|uniref:transcription factor TGA2.2-like n=1 Tax=Vicia villosa TaxID=3911 RepID=UPI00273A7D0B|nr:transcription factor TGA2.2-like [Vicia villosa]